MKESTLNYLIEASCKRLAPAWPIKNFVAVNPFTGFSDTSFSKVAKHMSERGGIRMTMPLPFYLNLLNEGSISSEDITEALEKSSIYHLDSDTFVENAQHLVTSKTTSTQRQLTLSGIASDLTGKDWNAHLVDRISSWASSYFDEYIALWNTTRANENVYTSWKREAEVDRSTEIMGLKSFRNKLKQLPDDHREAIQHIIATIKLPEEAVEAYFHSLLLKTVGWSSYISGLNYNAQLYQHNNSNKLEEFLAILLVWDFYFYEAFDGEKIKQQWYKNLYADEAKGAERNEQLEMEIVFQDAYDFACQRSLVDSFAQHTPLPQKERSIEAQMIFCIDVRSEVYRRHLESVTPTIETIGFAGFFGFPVNYLPLGHSQGKNQCPVLIPSSAEVKESSEDIEKSTSKRQVRHQVDRSWKKFKSGAVTSFGYVSPLGVSFLPKLLLNSLGITRPVPNPSIDGLNEEHKQERILDLSAISLEQKVEMAAGALTGMGIKDKLAPLVLITGHGSTSVNNPHASGLDCGACGGHSGEINAMTAAQILNDPIVRKELKKRDIHIPENTLFLACLHNTTTDEITIINKAYIPEQHKPALASLSRSLRLASEQTRLERSKRLLNEESTASKVNQEIISRANDWSQVRPEWGLAGCNTFVVAPRERTLGMNLKGKSFLQSYQAENDPGYAILESIMTAPMVVTSWINLQYYASTVDNERLGAGNKTLHNVTGGIGVLEGASGDLRIGLPLQSVHDGSSFQHLPERLNVVIEAPCEAINGVLAKHQTIRDLCDNSWITLLRLDENGRVSHRYLSDCKWQELGTVETNQENEIKTI